MSHDKKAPPPDSQDIRHTRNIFLRCISVIFLFAFTSLYVQIPGLYGKNGILPARTELDVKETDFAAKLQRKPTLLWLSTYLGLDTEYMMDVLALVGMFLAFTGFVSQKFCTKPTFAALWSLYYSLYQVGQTFMWFQWDTLLLETGFLCILVAPLRHKALRPVKGGGGKSSGGGSGVLGSGAPDMVPFWLLKWLLFRLMFSSGIVKLTSGCPAWWGLTALKVHFESMCIPTPLAWYSHHLPNWFLKLNTAFAIFSEIALPPLFFFPLRSVRIITFFIQAFLQVAIILTGNFNFFNYLTLALCLSLVDDNFFHRGSSKKTSWWLRIGKWAFGLAIYAALFYGASILFGLKLMPGGVIESKIMFTKQEFETALGRGLPILIAFGALSLIVTSLKALASVLNQGGSFLSKAGSFILTLFYIMSAFFIFTDSLVPFSTLHPSDNSTIHPTMREWHSKLSHLHLTNSYGLFRRITGVGGRPEVIIEGANKLEGPWAEYHFLYKPGDLNNSLPIVAPHQPRLDWQMWFAALGTYHQNPWIMSLTYRLLTGQPEVLRLIDSARNPFPNRPPKYMRAMLYHYHYTPYSQKNIQATWTRSKVSEYFPVFTKDHTPLLDYLKNLKILPAAGQDATEEKLSKGFIGVLNSVRAVFGAVPPELLMLSVFVSGLTVFFLGSLFGPSQTSSSSGSQQTDRQAGAQQSKRKKK